MIGEEKTVKKRFLLSLLVVPLAFLSACSDSSSSAQDAGEDTSTDVATDVMQDTGKDTGKDSQKDVVSDVLPDGGSDVAQDGDQDADNDVQDLDVQPDTNPDVAPDAEQDAEEDVDSATDADDADVYDGDVALDADAGPCLDTCLSITLTARFGAKTVKFERAFFGTESEKGGEELLYLEAYEGGSTTCPESSSPTPHFTLIVSGWPLNENEVTYDEGLRVTLFDFTGTILDPKPLVTATAATAKRTEACIDCAPWPTVIEPDTQVYIDIDAQFEGGEVKGQINASHCDSLDWIVP